MNRTHFFSQLYVDRDRYGRNLFRFDFHNTSRSEKALLLSHHRRADKADFKSGGSYISSLDVYDCVGLL